MAADITIKKGNRLPSVVVIARDAIGPVDLEGYTAVFKIVNVLTGAVEINNAAASVATNPTFTADASTNTLNSTAHGLVNGQDFTLGTDGTLPGNLSSQRRYYAINVSVNSLQPAETPGGSAVDIQNAGIGTHKLLLGKVSYDWQSADTDIPGTYRGQIETSKDGKSQTYPNDGYLTIEILSDLSDSSDRSKAIKAVSDLVQPDVAPTLTMGEVELEVDRAKLASTWTINTAYSAGSIVVVGNGHAYEVVQPGTSQATVLSANDWPAYAGAFVGDGNSNPQLSWRETGTAAFNPRIAGAEFNIYDIERAAKALARIKMVRCAQFIQDGDVSFQQMYEHWKEQWEYFRPFRRQIQVVRC